MKNKTFNPKRRTFAQSLLLGFTLCIFNIISNLTLAMAQEDPKGSAGIKDATTAVKGYFNNGIDLMYAIGALVGIIGAIKVFNKWNAGEPDTNKVAAAWFGSCVFLVVVATALKGFFITQ